MADVIVRGGVPDRKFIKLVTQAAEDWMTMNFYHEEEAIQVLENGVIVDDFTAGAVIYGMQEAGLEVEEVNGR